jgi:hypothetical protein
MEGDWRMEREERNSLVLSLIFGSMEDWREEEGVEGQEERREGRGSKQ